MHLKRVVVCGFRSYKDQVITEPFSNEHNVVIGRNGTGKSNFFDAIRFCLLTSRFANLRPDERQALLHEGSGKHVMSAYVEITFDNHDGRLPVDTEEVVLRRTIGVKKDEFFLNRKHITKTDVIHLLESAGFSRSNPYYIVQQGKVNALALMKEKERLMLLKEVAGTKVYEERRMESLKILQETRSRREKIQEVITYIDERLMELEEEKEELQQYQQLDREQRALEYTLHEKELQSIRMDLEAIERKRMEESSMVTALHERQVLLRQEIAQLQANQTANKASLVLLTNQRMTIETERKELMETRCHLELEVHELEEHIRVETQKRSSRQVEKVQIEQEIDQKQQELKGKLIPQFEQAKHEYDQLIQSLQDHARQSDQLIAKESRKSQFKTEKERDVYLHREIQEIDGLIHRKQEDAGAIQRAIDELTRTVYENESHARRMSEELQDRRQVVDSIGALLLELKERRNSMSEERKLKWRVENEISYDVRRVTDQLQRSESALQSTMAYDVRRGLQAVREMGASGKISGIYGPLIELVEPLDDRFCVAVDEAAAGSLFHVVVDTDDTAAKIMRELEKKNLGRITFLPLNRLKVKEGCDYPRDEHVFPLIDKLRFDAKIRRAVLTAFGKKLVCRDLDTCVQYAEQTNMDCLTLEGDMVHRRGALNGGFKDPTRSRSRSMLDIRRAQRELKEINDQAKKAKIEATQADQRVSTIIGEIQKQEAEKQHAMNVYERLFEEINRSKAQADSDRLNVNQKQVILASQNQEIRDLESKRTTIRTELTTKMEDGLTPNESEVLHALTTSISKLRSQTREQKHKLEELRIAKVGVETVLAQNLFRRRDELDRQVGEGLQEMAAHERRENLKAKKLDLANAIHLVHENEQFLSDVEKKIATLQEVMSNDKSRIDSLESEMSNVQDQLQQEACQSEKLLNRRRRLLQKREEAMKDIRELGTLLLSECEKFQSLQYREVLQAYNVCIEKLKSYNHVNKKALDQYVSFHEQRTTLLDRKKELDEGHDSIKDLIEVLDRRKDEAILRTFKGVSHHFSEVFRELVPTGEGKMLIIRTDTSNGCSDHNAIDTFSGVQIKVSFRGEGNAYLMQQLSGGQKALVALAFIFAIQRCDPAPFYLFDEIDQALDSTHRAAVAALIRRQAHSKENPAQFITSTFRPEMVNVADKFYGIGYQNKISRVLTMTKQESLDFIADIMAEEEVERTKSK